MKRAIVLLFALGCAPHYAQITPTLAIGDLQARSARNWTGVVSVITHTPRHTACCGFAAESSDAPPVRAGVPVLALDIADCGERNPADPPEMDLGDKLDEVVKFLDAHPGSLVHCWGGISRSAATAAAYLMARQGLDWDSAVSAVRRARPQANPGQCFREQVERWAAKRGAK